MARELGDVLHYYLPDSPRLVEAPERGAAEPVCAPASKPRSPSNGPGEPAATPLFVPLPPRDLVRTALLWNLGAELARRGAAVRLVLPSPESNAATAVAGSGPLGVEVETPVVENLAALTHHLARSAPVASGPRACTLVGVPIPWLRRDEPASAAWLRFVLVLARPDERELLENWKALEEIARGVPGARIGACIFGVRSLADARRAFEGLAALAELELDRTLVSYGVLIDDVHLSRSIVSRRPVVLAQPASPAARAFADVASMLAADLRLAGAEPAAHE